MAWLSKKGRPNKGGKSTESIVPKSEGHASAAELDPYSFQASHRRQAWMLRLSVGIIFALAAGLVVALNTISELVPLKTTEFALIRTYCEDDRTYSVEQVSKELKGFDIFMEARARRFVKILLEIDSVTQEERQREASQMADTEYWKKFRRERIDSGEIRKAIERGIDREITIETVTVIPTLTSENEFKFAVDYTQTDSRNGAVMEGSPKKLRAFLSMETRPQQNIPLSEKFTNPFGAYVTDLVLRNRGA